jgi:hypothetical protein
MSEGYASTLTGWNASGRPKIHHVSAPAVSPDRRVVGFYVDLGEAGPEAVVALVNAVASSTVAPVIVRAAIGRRGLD